jgi:hypothetical protein
MSIPEAGRKLFESLEGAREISPSDGDEATRRTRVTDLVMVLSAFPFLPHGTKQYGRAELKSLLPSVDQLDDRSGIRQALSKIEHIFTTSQRVPSNLRITSSH